MSPKEKRDHKVEPLKYVPYHVKNNINNFKEKKQINKGQSKQYRRQGLQGQIDIIVNENITPYHYSK